MKLAHTQNNPPHSSLERTDYASAVAVMRSADQLDMVRLASSDMARGGRSCKFRAPNNSMVLADLASSSFKNIENLIHYQFVRSFNHLYERVLNMYGFFDVADFFQIVKRRVPMPASPLLLDYDQRIQGWLSFYLQAKLGI